MDPTENLRRVLVAELNASLPAEAADRFIELTNQYSQVWTTETVQNDFEIIGFMAPFVLVIRKSDHVRGTLEFCHSPRFYFNFEKG